MVDIYINNRVQLDRFGLRVKDLSNRLTRLHRKQGDMDGACVVYCVIMALLCIGHINGADIGVYPDVQRGRKGNKDRFLDHLLQEQGFVREGYYLSTMAKEIRMYFSDINVMYHRKKENFLDHIFAYIEDDCPVIVTVLNARMNHAIFVIGVEYNELDEVVKLFCLDPAEPLDNVSYWNCIIDTSKGIDNDSLCWYITNGIKSKVEIKEVLSLEECYSI